MNKKFFAAVSAIIALVFASLAAPAHADAQWATGLAWSNLHVKAADGVFENWHREWTHDKPSDMFAPDKIDYNSATQHNLAFVRTDKNSFTTTYDGGVSQANKQITFIFQGYDADGNAMNFSVATPGVSPVPQPSPTTLAGSPTYFDAVTVTADSTGHAEATTSLLTAPAAYDSIIASILTKVADVTPTAVDKVVTVKKKPLKTKTVTTVTYANTVGAPAGTSYQYSTNGGTVWTDAPASPFTLDKPANPITMRAVNVVGPEVTTWQPAGWRPVIKLVGTPTGRQCVMNQPSVNLCAGIDFRDQTFDWSVANRAWFQGSQLYDYAQAYAKTYTPGSTVSVKFFVRDIWGTPIAKLPLNVAVNGGSAAKWGKYNGSIKTDNSGYATFTVTNKNTAAQILAHTDVNPDPPHKKTGGIIGFVIYVTSNQIDEVADQMWFQLAADTTIAGGCPNSTDTRKCPLGGAEVPILLRGPNATTDHGNYWAGDTMNPDMTLDPSNTSLNDVIIGALNITRLKNLKSQFLWAPDVTITATNGGLSSYATVAQKDNGYADFASAAAFKPVTTFGYTYYQDLAFMATQPGVTTWTIHVGKWSYSFSQSYKR